MIDFIVIEKNESGEWKGHGSHKFKLAPRQGEYVTFNDEKGIGQVYQVLAVIHPLQEAPTAGDLIIKHINNITSFQKSL